MFRLIRHHGRVRLTRKPPILQDLRKTGRTVEDDWPEYWEYARQYGSIFSSIAGVNEHSFNHHDASGQASEREKGVTEWNEKYGHDQDQFEDASDEGQGVSSSARFRARRDTEAHVPRTPVNLSASNTPQMLSSPHMSPEKAGKRPTHASPDMGASAGQASARGPSRASFVDSFFGKGASGRADQGEVNQHGEIVQAGTKGGRRVSRAPTVIPRKQAITQQDLVASGERIYLRYLLSGAEKEIYLPYVERPRYPPCRANSVCRPPIRIHDFPGTPELEDDSSHPADPRIPDYFHTAKEYIFKALQDDAFVRFIRAKAFCNLTRLGTFLRLFAGLFCLWAGFVVAFTLVFYDYKPKIRRLFVSPNPFSTKKLTNQTAPSSSFRSSSRFTCSYRHATPWILYWFCSIDPRRIRCRRSRWASRMSRKFCAVARRWSWQRSSF